MVYMLTVEEFERLRALRDRIAQLRGGYEPSQLLDILLRELGDRHCDDGEREHEDDADRARRERITALREELAAGELATLLREAAT